MRRKSEEIGALCLRQAKDLFGCLLGIQLLQGAGYRTTELQLASTVLDPEQLSATQMAAIYLSRWQVELFMDDLKTTLGMAILTTRSPSMIRRELLMHIIAYNLVRSLM